MKRAVLKVLSTLLILAAFPASGAQAAPSAAVASPATRFTLTETRSGASFGPFTLFDGARVRVDGTLYRVVFPGNGRVTFVDSTNGRTFGPYQPVEGRLMQLGKAMYAFGGAGKSGVRGKPAASGAPGRAAAHAAPAPIAEFAPMPPKPELIEIPPEVEHRQAPSLDLPGLPDATRPPAWSIWLAPLDTTPFKWKVESVSGKKADFERTTLGGGLGYNSWLAEAAYSTSGKSSAIVPGGLGFSGSSIDDADGFSLAIGYKRPFLREGGWTASAGILGRIRQDKGDISSTALVATSKVDTNNVENVVSEYRSGKSSVKITEKALRLDFDLSYRSGQFMGFAGLQIQPVSSVSVSGHMPYGSENLKISAKHDDAIGAIVGGSYTFWNDFQVFADLTLIYESRLRIGVSREF